MIHFPIFEKLIVRDYALYPGKSGEGLNIDFQKGLSLILGANGLGKTTLINILYRLLTGPYDIPALSKSSKLGTAKLEVAELSTHNRLTFAKRVADNAADAEATLQFRIGNDSIYITRSLQRMKLVSFQVNGRDLGTDEAFFQSEIARMVDVWDFCDWILILRYLIFYFEDRKALVWDHTAQKQLFRILFLTKEDAEKWYKEERLT
jgi:energy-coupling factor transporter ATP-binding protein EcfA2